VPALQQELSTRSCSFARFKLRYANSTGHEQWAEMACNAAGFWEVKVPTGLYGPLLIDFIGHATADDVDGTSYGDNQDTGTLVVSGGNIQTPYADATVLIDDRSMTYYFLDDQAPCGHAQIYVGWIGEGGYYNVVGTPMQCGADGVWTASGRISGSVRDFWLMDEQASDIPGTTVWGDAEPVDGIADIDGAAIRTWDPNRAGNPITVRFDLRTQRYEVVHEADWQRTVVFIYGETQPGQDMFIRGGLDHARAEELLGLSCTSTNMQCAIPVRHLNLLNTTTEPWKGGDTFLDWYGRQPLQEGWSHGIQADGSPLDWTTNDWPSSWGPARTVPVDGYGLDSENTVGMHYWKLDVEMDCSKAVSWSGARWFELKSYITNGPGWEQDVWPRQSSTPAGAPYESINHFAQCGKISVFRRGSPDASFAPIASCFPGIPCAPVDTCRVGTTTCTDQVETCEDTAPKCGVACEDGACLSVQQLSAGNAHVCALMSDGSVRCWGDDTHGQLGGSSPLTAVPLDKAAKKVAAGWGHTCALLVDSTVRCWGYQNDGVLGGGSLTTSIPGLTDVEDIAVGSTHSCARMRDRTVRCWGNSESGQTGDSSPTTPIAGLSGVVDLAAEGASTCARLEDGSVKCWGEWTFCAYPCRLPTPTVVPGLQGATQLAFGPNVCGLMADGTLRCKSSIYSWDFTTVPDITTARSIAGQGDHVCSVLADGTVRCFGQSQSPALGGSSTSTPVAGLSGATQVVTGWSTFSCALVGSAVRCWGAPGDPVVADGSAQNAVTMQ